MMFPWGIKKGPPPELPEEEDGPIVKMCQCLIDLIKTERERIDRLEKRVEFLDGGHSDIITAPLSEVTDSAFLVGGPHDGVSIDTSETLLDLLAEVRDGWRYVRRGAIEHYGERMRLYQWEKIHDPEDPS